MAIIVQLGLFVLFVLLIVVTIFSAKRWRVLHLLAFMGVFVTSIIFLFLAAFVLKTQTVYRTRYNETAAKLEAALREQQLLRFGDPTEVVQSTESRRSQSALLRRIIHDRGRVWRNLSVANAQGASITLNVPPRAGASPLDGAAAPAPAEPAAADAADPAAAAGEPAAVEVAPESTKNHQIEPQTTLYAFKELPTPDGFMAPAFYLGKFSAAAVTDTTVTVTPVLPPDQEQIAQINNPQGAWVLYEVMPVDASHKFAHLSEEEIRALLPPERFGVPDRVSQEVYERVLDEYLRDGKTASEDDPPERTWITVKFLERHTVPVDVADEATELTTQDFDASGRALANQLRQGSDTVFEVGDFGTFVADEAEQLIAQGIAQRGETVFARELRDYDYHFTTIDYRSKLIDDSIALVEADTASLNQAIANAQQHIEFREDERAKLTSDLERFREELTLVTSYRDNLTAAFDAVQRNVRNLYASSLRLSAELTEWSRRMTEQIDERTRQARLEAQASAP